MHEALSMPSKHMPLCIFWRADFLLYFFRMQDANGRDLDQAEASWAARIQTYHCALLGATYLCVCGVCVVCVVCVRTHALSLSLSLSLCLSLYIYIDRFLSRSLARARCLTFPLFSLCLPFCVRPLGW